MQKWQQAVLGLGLFLLTVLNAQAQDKCATMSKHEHLLKIDPNYRAVYEQGLEESQKARPFKEGRTEVTVYKVPVVVHIMHIGEPVGTGSNISNEQVYSAIASMNDAYRKKAGSIYYGNGVDMSVEFCLVQKDPNGHATSGINRVNASATGSYGTMGITDANETDIKALSKWNNTKYYNIWVVSEIDDNGGGSGVQGYAYFPGAPAAYDGAVMLYNAFGYDPEGTRNYNLKSYTDKNITCIHEMGHAFNLYHPFEGDGDGSTCPAQANGCGSGVGDCCEDIPACKRSNSDCVSGINECDGVTSRELVIHNYMNYSSDDCTNMFTANQSTRVTNVLTSGGSNGRASLVSNTNLTACGCNSNTAPIPRFYASPYQPCEGTAVQFYDESLNAPASYSWTFEGGTPATSTSQNPVVSYSNGAGPFAVSLKVTSTGSQSATLTKDSCINPIISFNPPFIESFEDNASDTTAPSYWQIVSDDASTPWGTKGTKQWVQRTVAGSGSDTSAMAINFYKYNSARKEDDLITPLINLTGITVPSLMFNVAYRFYGYGSTDSLYVLVTTDCGVTYTKVYSKGGLTLQTTTTTGNAEFVPAITDWRTETVDLSAFAGQKIQLVFKGINAYGDNLYLDDVSVTGVSAAPVADFKASKTNGVANAEPVTFTNESTGSITTYAWDFGADATPATANTAGPFSVSYSSLGAKTITLTVTGPGGTNTVTKTDFVNVVASVISPESLESAGIRVYPNPTKDIVYIDSDRSQFISAQVLDVLSNTVIGEQVKSNSARLEINLAGKPQGLYILLIKTSQGNFGTRILKTN